MNSAIASAQAFALRLQDEVRAIQANLADIAAELAQTFSGCSGDQETLLGAEVQARVIQILRPFCWQVYNLAIDTRECVEQGAEEGAAAVHARQQHQAHQTSPASLRSYWKRQRV
jgi:cob(I)alamin adenosyltransferase